MMNLKVAITGGIGSGKSVVSELLELMGVPVYVADTRSKIVTVSDLQIRKELIELFGEKVYKGEELNRPFLAFCIFGNPEAVTKVNAIIHPRVKADFLEWVSAHAGYKIVAIESAILLEAGFTDVVDKIIMVYAPLELRIERAMKRDSVSLELVQKRISSQMDDEEKKKQADYVILNDDKTAIIPQLERILKGLCDL